VSAAPTPTKPSLGSKILKITRDVLGVVLVIAGLPGGSELLDKIPVIGKGVGKLIRTWGLRPLANVLDILPDGVEITDEMLAEAIERKGGKLEPIDMATFYGPEAPVDPS
jgi:hypothetical protein